MLVNSHIHTHTDYAVTYIKSKEEGGEKEEDKVELEDKKELTSIDDVDKEDKPKKKPSKDAPLRCMFLGIFLALVVPVMITLIVLIVIPA